MPAPHHLDRLRVVLVGTRNPLNLGVVARAMSNFGVAHLRVVRPYEPSFREARSAVGPAAAVLVNAQEFDSLAAAVADCSLVVGTTAVQHRELQHQLHPLPEAAAQIAGALAASPVAVVFGSEKTGLSNTDLSLCHWLLHIPTRDAHLSMNLGQAVTVTLYELARDRNIAAAASDVPATSDELQRLTSVLLEALDKSGYTTPATAAATEEKTRRLVRRLQLSSRDAEVLLGMLRQVLWKIDR